MTCETFLDRLYDDDTRAAARGEGAVPPDVSRHMITCGSCREAYAAAGADDLLVSRALLESPPPAWRAGVLRKMARPARAPWTHRIAVTNQVVTWGVLAIAALHVLIGESSTAAFVTAFLAGGAAALVRPALGKQSMIFLRRPVRWV